MQKPLVSIGVITYQAAPYIRDCIKGILSQTYPNLELVILDDASTDRTLSIIELFMKKLKQKCVRVEIIRHNVNSGNIPYNCNELVRKCEGDYIKFCAGDDALSPCCIEELVEFLEKNKDCVAAYSNGYVVPNSWHTGRAGKYPLLFPQSYEHPSEDLFERLLYGNFVQAAGTIHRRFIFEKYGYYDETLLYEDWDLWLRLAMNHVRIAYVDKVLVYYRNSVTGITRNSSRKVWIRKWNQRAHLLHKYRSFVSKEEMEYLKLHHITEFLADAKRYKYYDLALVLWWRKQKLLKRVGRKGHVCRS